MHVKVRNYKNMHVKVRNWGGLPPPPPSIRKSQKVGPSLRPYQKSVPVFCCKSYLIYIMFMVKITFPKCGIIKGKVEFYQWLMLPDTEGINFKT